MRTTIGLGHVNRPLYKMSIGCCAQTVARQVRFVDYIPWTVNLSCRIFADMKKRMNQICRVLADNVKALRLARALTQEELAFDADLDRTYISQLERGVANPSILVLVKISEVLGVELQELFVKH